jgi:hypothetical protein
MYNKYNLILFTTIIFLIIIVINYSYNINYKKLEKFNTDSECGDENIFMDNQVQNFCSQICQYPGAGKTPEVKAAAQEKCRLNCPSIARNKLIKGMALGNDYLLKGHYKKTYNVKEEEKKIAENVLSSQVIKNSRLTHILKEDCTQEQLDIILNDMKKDKYGNWIKIGDSPTQYTYDDKVSILCSSDKNYVNTNIEPHFKNSEINDIIDQHSIIGLLWFEFGNKYNQEIISYTSQPDFIEITNPNFIEALSNKIDANKPLKFTKTEINQLFDTNATNISVKNYVIINDIVYFPLSPLDSRHPVWLYNVKQIAEMREKWYQNLNREISKLDDITPCTYYNDEIATLPNKISHNGIQWGKIGSSQNQYSSISKYNEAIAAKENAINNCKYTNQSLDSLPNKFTEDSIEWGKIGSSQNQYSSISKYNEAIAAKENAINNCKYTNESLDSLPNKFSEDTVEWGKIGSNPNEYSSISKYNEAIAAKENAINDCKYTNESLDSLPNKFSEDTVEWGKIGSNPNEYSLISNLKQKENVAKENCLIPGVLHEDISNLPNKLTNPTTGEIYGKYLVIPSNEKYTASYNYPYIDRNNLDNNLSDMCFVSKDNMTNDKGELLWGQKQKYGGEYGLIGGWRDFLLDPDKEKRYGKIKTSTNDGWVGKIGNNTGEYGKIGFSYDDPTGYRWVLFKPKAEQISNNPNIINNQELSTILNGNNEYIITKNKFDSLNISSITVDSLISGAVPNTWYKPRDNIYINSNTCDSYNSQLMSAVDEDISSNREQQTLDLTMKYMSPDKTRFVSSVNCPSTCTKNSSNTGECAPCFRKGLITVALSDWSKLVDSINNNVSGLNTLIQQCENNLIYSENGTNKVKKLANYFKVLKFKVSKTKPVSGNNILTNNKDMNKTLMIEKITKNEDIDAYTWNQLNINVIGPSDYVKHNSNYYVIDNETFLEIIKDYSDMYEQEYQSKKQTIPDCTVAYNLINKTNNTCLAENHQCIPKTNITTVDYTSKIDEAIGTKSDWYIQNYQEGRDIAKNKKGKYYPVPGVNKLGEPNQNCVPPNYTKNVSPGTKYIRPNTCPPNQSCRLPCKNCQNDDLECKKPEFKYTQTQYNAKKQSQLEAGSAAAKGKYVNTYDGITNCVPSNYLPIIEGGKRRVKIGDTASACTGGAQCDNLPQEAWNTILESVRKEKAANERECARIGTSQKTCLKECENNQSCNLNRYNLNNVKDMATTS